VLNPDVKKANIDPVKHYLDHGMKEGRRYRAANPVLGLGLIVKDEAPYILEWIAYHMVLGVDKFIIADNNSSDGTKEILVNLHSAGLIDLIHFNGHKKISPQLPAYTEILNSAQGVDWLGFIDADEFIELNSDLSLKKLLLDIFDNEEIGAIALNWAIYGSSGLSERENGLVVERFTNREFQIFIPNFHYKSILKLNSISNVGSTPHKFQLSGNQKYAHINGDDLFDNLTYGEGLSTKIVWNPVKLNHYMLKSKFEFDIRSKKPNASNARLNDKDEVYFKFHDRNEKFDPINEKLISVVKLKIDELKGVAYKKNNFLNFEFRSNDRGSIDSVVQEKNLIKIVGWAFLFVGAGVEILSAHLNDYDLEIVSIKAFKREDIFQTHNTASAFCGFELICNLEAFDFSNLCESSSIELVLVQGSQVEILKSSNLIISSITSSA
jgi:hypothetical protein